MSNHIVYYKTIKVGITPETIRAVPGVAETGFQSMTRTIKTAGKSKTKHVENW